MLPLGAAVRHGSVTAPALLDPFLTAPPGLEVLSCFTDPHATDPPLQYP
jgi:hypothetical protein